MHNHQYVERFVSLLDPDANILLNATVDEAVELLGSGDAEALKNIEGQFALVHRNGHIVRMARSIGRPMRYFLAKQVDGPCLVVAERMDEIRDWLIAEGLDGQFHPSYTRMVPAHHIVEIALLGCPDPNPQYTRFFTPQRNRLPANLDEIGGRYIGALQASIAQWIDQIDPTEPIGVLFSGGIDSGAVFCTTYDCLLKRGDSPARLKAFTLSIDGQGRDADQAHRFLSDLDLGMFLEVIDCPVGEVDYREAIRVIEDYKPLDVQAATMGLALCRGIRRRYPDWKYLLDGDGGDENLKDYPIEENRELTIRSVLNNLMLYQEGWGVDAIKHSLTYSGGQSRGHVRSFAPVRQTGFQGFSPFAVPRVIEVAEGIPFIELTDWQHDKLYALKGEIVRRGVEQVTGLTMPTFEKCRFQHGASTEEVFANLFPADEQSYRNAFRQVLE
ncbi:asparagine synthase-related protein [Rosistilla oblonga]|uniref:Asparagine synthase n=1 Tax=Rosistilla oblonga TaxID=2527990 RepID=A0A518IWZ1_9BACT|nr:asparagine synthase-related protein [Rosistilla oblonga]QDV57610.1 Asparagine synthase [Rosistilla oblonga]